MFNVSINILTYIMFLLLPYYYLKSGKIQPVDFIIIIIFGLLVLSRNTISSALRRSSSIYCLLMILFIYSILIYLLNYLFNNQNVSLQLMIQTVYYMLLSFMYLSLLNYYYLNYSKQKFYEKILRLLLISTMIPLVILLIKHNVGYNRAALSFNNLNIF